MICLTLHGRCVKPVHILGTFGLSSFFLVLILMTLYIEREVPDDNNTGSRVDFKITCKNDPKPFLVEVKIWDQNHHFGQYEKAYGVDKERLGYITNYPYKKDGYDVKQWRDLCNSLQKCIEEDNIPEEESDLLSGYCEYVKNVCGIIMVTEKIDLSRMTSLYDLTVVLRQIAEYTCPFFDVKNYGTTHRDDLRWLFLEVDYKQTNGWGRQYPFMGIIYRHPEPYICAGFDCRKGWARGIVEFMRNNSQLFSRIKTEYCSQPEPSGDYYFKMSAFAKREFQGSKTIDDQKTVLRNFLNEVLMFPINLLRVISEDEDRLQRP